MVTVLAMVTILLSFISAFLFAEVERLRAENDRLAEQLSDVDHAVSVLENAIGPEEDIERAYQSLEQTEEFKKQLDDLVAALSKPQEF